MGPLGVFFTPGNAPQLAYVKTLFVLLLNQKVNDVSSLILLPY